MRSGAERQTWRGFAVLTVAGVLLSVAFQEASLGGPAGLACNTTAPTCNGTCPGGQICVPFSRFNASECSCRDIGCCLLTNNSCIEDVTALDCEIAGTQWVANGTCGVDCVAPTQTPTATATATATPTATATGIPNGGSCADPADCASGNCVDDVCCDTACNGPQESCNQPGNAGVCTAIAAPAPAVSGGGLVLIIAALGIIAGVALWRRRAG